MANLFAGLRVYAGNWNLTGSRNFTDEEIACIASNEVVASQYGKSVCFTMVSGGKTFIPLSTNSSLNIGDSLDMKTAKVLTLSKAGEADIMRVE